MYYVEWVISYKFLLQTTRVGKRAHCVTQEGHYNTAVGNW